MHKRRKKEKKDRGAKRLNIPRIIITDSCLKERFLPLRVCLRDKSLHLFTQPQRQETVRNQNRSRYGLNCVPFLPAPPFTGRSPNHHCDCIWRWGLWEVIRVRWHHPWGPHIGVNVLMRRREIRACCLPCEDVVRRWLSASQEEEPHRGTKLALDLGLTSLQNSEKYIPVV